MRNLFIFVLTVFMGCTTSHAATAIEYQCVGNDGQLVGVTGGQLVWRIEDEDYGATCYVTGEGSISCLPTLQLLDTQNN